jgi:hypothetical protein
VQPLGSEEPNNSGCDTSLVIFSLDARLARNVGSFSPGEGDRRVSGLPLREAVAAWMTDAEITVVGRGLGCCCVGDG